MSNATLLSVDDGLNYLEMSSDKCYVGSVDNVDKGTTGYLNFSFPVDKGVQRFRELIIYVSRKSVDDVYFGAVKLNKILYYSDFLAFYRFGQPLTGFEYFRIQKGPAPRAMIPISRELAKEGAIRFEQVMLGGHMQIRTIALRAPIMQHFSEDEILLVDEVIRSLWFQNATEVSDASHDVRWRVLQHKDPMPYEFAFLDDEITNSDIERTAELARELGW
ncbi:MAG: Panacea domain-containing protein [Methylocella sp.]